MRRSGLRAAAGAGRLQHELPLAGVGPAGASCCRELEGLPCCCAPMPPPPPRTWRAGCWPSRATVSTNRRSRVRNIRSYVLILSVVFMLILSDREQQVIQSYARRMNIEQRLAEAIQSFSLDALAGAVPLNVDLDVVLSVLAHTVCAALRRRLPGYHAATPDTLQRRFLNTAGIIHNQGSQIVIRLNRRTYSPVLRQASLPEMITVPWWEGRTLRYEYA